MKNTFKDFIKKYFELDDQVEIKINEPPNNTNTISVKFNVKKDHLIAIQTKLEDVKQLSASLNGLIDNTMYPNTEITDVKEPKITEITSGKKIDS